VLHLDYEITPVKKLDVTVNIEKIAEECSYLIDCYGLKMGKNIQLVLQHSEFCENKWHDGTGSLPRKFTNDQTYRAIDTIYTEINSELKNLYISEVLGNLSEKFSIYRTRIMVLDSRGCYSWHRDQSPRLHLAVKTNYHCRMVFESGSYHIPADGHWYFTNTVQFHSAFNGGQEHRMHIVAGID